MLYVFGINADRGGMGNSEKLLALLHAWKPVAQGNPKLLTLLGSGEHQTSAIAGMQGKFKLAHQLEYGGN
jgi:hypothetical protein